VIVTAIKEKKLGVTSPFDLPFFREINKERKKKVRMAQAEFRGPISFAFLIAGSFTRPPKLTEKKSNPQKTHSSVTYSKIYVV